MKQLLIILLLIYLIEPKPLPYQYTKVSWYGNEFNGELTASGKIFNSNNLVAAHRKLPFGTKVKIININNNKSVIVTIIDRGPFIKSRDFDLSEAAFNSIANLNKGIINIKYLIL
jgi:rare lipoprotein A